MGSGKLNRATSVSRKNLSLHRNIWSISSIFTLAKIFLLLSLLLASGCIFYLFLYQNLYFKDTRFDFIGRKEVCNVFEGSWIPDSSYPLYNSSICSFVERGFNCLANGRRDEDYLKWKWKPWRCHIPPFDVNRALESLRGKRVVFVGDSMSRTQWESFICMLMTGVPEPKSVYEVNGNKISKTIPFLGVRFDSFNLTVEFFRSVFLVQLGLPPKHGPKRIQSALKLDKLDEMSKKWVDSDVLVVNSGHWWNPVKLFDSGCYFQVGGTLKLGLPITAAFKIAMETWASWVESSVDTARTHIFFRTFEPSHQSDPNEKSCKEMKQSEVGPNGLYREEFLGIINDVVRKMKAPVTILNVTSMGAVRSDAHIGQWNGLGSLIDCSHWCLPGVPDAWNELIFHLLAN